MPDLRPQDGDEALGGLAGEDGMAGVDAGGQSSSSAEYLRDFPRSRKRLVPVVLDTERDPRGHALGHPIEHARGDAGDDNRDRERLRQLESARGRVGIGRVDAPGAQRRGLETSLPERARDLVRTVGGVAEPEVHPREAESGELVECIAERPVSIGVCVTGNLHGIPRYAGFRHRRKRPRRSIRARSEVTTRISQPAMRNARLSTQLTTRRSVFTRLIVVVERRGFRRARGIVLAGESPSSRPGRAYIPVMAGGSAGRVAALTGLRGLAAASVLFYHVWLYGAPGAHSFPSGPLLRVFVNLEFGVTFFFVLSGSLLYRSYARALLAGDPLPRLSHFVIARVLRIVPTYWAILLLVMALTERHLFSQPWPLLANLFFLEFWIPSFFPDNLGVANGSMAIVPSWSLAVEAGFYLSLPLLAVLALWFARRTGRRVAAAFVPPIALTLLGLVAVAVEHVLGGNLRRAWAVGFPIHAGWFACGMAGATLGFLFEQEHLRLPAYWRSGAVVAALALTAGSIKLHNVGAFSRVDYQWPVAIALSLLLLLVMLAEDGGRLRTILGSRVLVAMGLASYSIFLVHDPVIRELRTHDLISSGIDGFLLALLLVGGATSIAATVSYQFLERPCFALKRRLTRPFPDSSARAGRPALVHAC